MPDLDNQQVKITECPRDAMQGLSDFIPTALKAEYINKLLKVGFNTIDFGSFVSPKAIPQMRDTAEVLSLLDLDNTSSKLLAIIANYRGAVDASHHEAITYLGYPFSVSETFQLRNTNMNQPAAFETVKQINALCYERNKKLLVYLSMGFGNPYKDYWSPEVIEEWTEKLEAIGVKHIALADTIGIAQPEQITQLYPQLVNNFSDIDFGIHLHATPDTAPAKIAAAYQSGCRHFDTAIKGFGGCPMAKDELTGNIATEALIGFLTTNGINTVIDMENFGDAFDFSSRVFH
jgi:hydroxymethylglutaryl-CoA lyase